MFSNTGTTEPLRKVRRNGWGFGGNCVGGFGGAADATKTWDYLCDRGHRGPGQTFGYGIRATFIRKPIRPQHPRANMPNSQIPSSITERRLAIAHRLYEALVGQDPDRAIILCNTSGKVVTRHDPRLEQSSPETA